jgi:hypothetical protein
LANGGRHGRLEGLRGVDAGEVAVVHADAVGRLQL